MALFKTIILFGVTVIAMICLIPAAFPFFILSLFGLRRAMSLILYRLAQGWARLIIVLTGCKMTVHGRENIPKKGGVCFVSNHVGIFDIILALGYAGRPFGFIAKKELLFLPGINLWIYLLGGLFIDRKHPRKALKTINMGIKRIKSGGAMLIFPEGTRSKGGGLAAFHPGSLKLATQSDSHIVPVALSGSYDVFEKERRAASVPVHVTFLPAIESSALPPEDRKTLLAEKLHDDIAAALEEQKHSG